MAYDFNTIARDYDRMNHLMTAGLDRRWRRRAVRPLLTPHSSPLTVLDVACGTGDLALELCRQGFHVTGIDLSEEMLAIARQKFVVANFQFSIFNFQLANAEALSFADGSFDAVTCAFGVRNFVHLDLGLAEMYRVLKPGGRLMIMELATPDTPLVRPFYRLYTRRIIPWLGQRLAGSREAYTYLPASIERFPKGEAFLQRLAAAGFVGPCERKLTFGVCRLYTATKQ